MGFHRLGQPASPLPSRAAVASAITRFVATEVAFENRTADPFGIGDRCPNNAGGPHQFIASCGDVVCCHCARVVWQ